MEKTVTPEHIGIVACSADGAALCYRTICVEGARSLGPHAHPEVSMHTHSFAEYVKCIDRGDWEGVGAPTTPSTGRLLSSNRDRRCPGCTSPRSSLQRRPSAGSGASD